MEEQKQDVFPNIFYKPQCPRIGTHIAKEKTIEASVRAFLRTRLDAFQIYIANSRSYVEPNISVDDILATRKLIQDYELYFVIHGSLLYNLCGAVKLEKDPKYKQKKYNMLKNLAIELDIGAGLGVGVVVHVGSCVDKKRGVEEIANNIDCVLNATTKYTEILSKKLGMTEKTFMRERKVILENSAGEGNKLGSTLEEINKIIQLVSYSNQSKVKVCIDTQHIFGAGQYNFGKIEDIDRFYNDFDTIVDGGVDDVLELFHFNDSEVSFNSKKDRHANLTYGYIFGTAENREEYFTKKTLRKAEGIEVRLECKSLDNDKIDALEYFIQKAEEYQIPFVGEPPMAWKNDDEVIGKVFYKR